MKVLLDHRVAWQFARALPEHQVRTAAEMGWELLKNGPLLKAAASAGFDAFITIDKSLRHQQNLMKLPLTVLEINLPDSKLKPLLAAGPSVLEALKDAARFRFLPVHSGAETERLAERHGTQIASPPARAPERPQPNDKNRER